VPTRAIATLTWTLGSHLVRTHLITLNKSIQILPHRYFFQKTVRYTTILFRYGHRRLGNIYLSVNAIIYSSNLQIFILMGRPHHPWTQLACWPRFPLPCRCGRAHPRMPYSRLSSLPNAFLSESTLPVGTCGGPLVIDSYNTTPYIF
jgi:hypothetical protein